MCGFSRGYTIFLVEIIPPKDQRIPEDFLKTVVGDTAREVETRRVEKVVTSSTVEDDLRKALLERTLLGKPSVNLPLSERSFDLVLLSDWESQILYSEVKDEEMPSELESERAINGVDSQNPPTQNSEQSSTTSNKRAEEVMTPANETLESGVWTQSIIWDSKTPFRDFTQLEIIEEPSTSAEPETVQIPGISTAFFFYNRITNCSC